MSEYNDYRSEIEMWADMWDQAQAEDIHPAPEPPQPSEFAASILGDDDPADAYWDFMDTEEQLLQEEHKTPNPVYPDSVGPDYEDPKPAWVSEDLLKEIESLKDQLFKVENKMAKMGAGEKLEQKARTTQEGKLMSEIESLRKRIEKVSSSLGVEHEPSPWVVKED